MPVSDSLSVRERNVLDLRKMGMTLKQIGAQLGISANRTHQIWMLADRKERGLPIRRFVIWTELPDAEKVRDRPYHDERAGRCIAAATYSRLDPPWFRCSNQAVEDGLCFVHIAARKRADAKRTELASDSRTE